MTMQQLVDFIVEKEIQKRVKSGALCGATTATKRANNEQTSNSKLSAAAQKVLDESYQRVREGNITSPTIKSASTIATKPNIPKSWLNYDNQFNNTRLEQSGTQLKSASTKRPVSFDNFFRLRSGITAQSPGPNTEVKGKTLSASEEKMPASWINYRRLTGQIP